MDVVDDQDALVGLLVNDTVKKNSRELLVEVTNNVTDSMSVAIELEDNTQGTLYGPDGNSGNTVTFSLAAATAGSTDSAAVDIEASVNGTMIPVSITATTVDSKFSFQAIRETEAVAGNTSGAVEIKKVKKFEANNDSWGIQQVEVTANDFELDRVEYKITTETDGVVGTRIDDVSGNSYDRKGTGNNPAVVIEPDDSNHPTSSTDYTLTVTAYDNEDNFDVATRTDAA
ncbi:hypothetical protein [Natrinema soli]|uniref:Cadherin domain-containing protein n=1 Tax=Natrinema soli TaxID=1930624 RepID=A0ABD5SK22_9EURY|nr:hypothetical protein [Natrinema soli]